MKVIVAYDIADETRLRKVAKIAEDYGTRVQKSIFELDVRLSALKEMMDRVAATIEPEEDGVKYFLLCEKCAHREVEIIGQGVYVDPDTAYEVI